MLFTTQGVINIKNKQWANDFSVIDAGLPNEISQYYSKAYLRHLFVAKEILALQLASVHNLAFYLWLVGEARKQILADNYRTWKADIQPIIQRRL
jgi:queuine tRNA-ribosyltransferase